MEKRRMSGGEKAAISISVIVFALFLGMAAIAVLLFDMLKESERDYFDYRSEAEIQLSELQKEKTDKENRLNELNARLELAEITRNDLERRIAQVEGELKQMESSFENKDELYSQLNAELRRLEESLVEKQTEINALKEDILRLEEVYTVDINRLHKILTELETLLTEGAPMNKVETPKLNEDGTPVLGEDGLPVMEVTYVYPKISVYYADLENGYSYAWNGDQSYSSASCVKAAYALSILKAASDEKAEYDRLLAEYIAQNGPVDVLPGYAWTYDFDRVFTYAEEDYRSGSGVIKNEEYGVQYTHLELFEYLLRDSDNVAFGELREVYGIELLRELVKELGTKSMKYSNVFNASAKDLGIIMKEIYRFTEGSSFYGPFMKETMKDSIHTVMIGYGVSPKKIAHKYGWDVGAYHDMAIVYDDYPYVLVFMSDMDGGGTDVNTYVQKVAGLIDDLHENFYK